MSSTPAPKICDLRVRPVLVPMQEPHRTASGEVTQSPLVLTDVITEEGINGHSMVFTYTPAALKPIAGLIRNIETIIKGDAIAPTEIEQKLAKQFRLLETQGLVGMAIAAIDSFTSDWNFTL
jgi:mandelate racemase